MRAKWICAGALVLGLLYSLLARASFHEYRINQIFSNADGAVQYVMLHESTGSDGENFLGGHALVTTSASGTQRFVFPNDLPSTRTANTFVLIATQGFASLNLIAPDYIIPMGFIPTTGGTMNYASVDSVTFGPLPTDGVNALDRVANVVVNSPTNFAGQTTSIGTAIKPQTGWWWSANESGRGFFMELSGSTLLLAGYLYDVAGNPLWFIAPGPYGGNQFSGMMTTYAQGQSLTGPYQAPVTTPSPGSISIAFKSATEGTLTWPGGSMPIIRFRYAVGGRGFPESGWWWSPNESGRGFSIETQGNVLFIAGYMYDTAGNPIWYISAGPMTSITTGGGIYGGSDRMTTTWSYSGTWQQYANGQAMGAPYRAPTLVSGNVGNLSLVFSDSQNATMTLPDGRKIPLTRFGF